MPLPRCLRGCSATLRGKRVADLCAAPGGKTAQLIAGGRGGDRRRRIAEPPEAAYGPIWTGCSSTPSWSRPTWRNGSRTSCSTRCCWMRLAHRLARCAGIPMCHGRNRVAEIEKLAGVQRRLLDAAVQLVKPGGRIVFSNCSLDPLEGEDLYAAFLVDHPDVEPDPVRPGEFPDLDGFLTRAGDAANHTGRSGASYAGDVRPRRFLRGPDEDGRSAP